MVTLKYTGRLGYLEARYRLGIGDRKKLLELIEEEKNKRESGKISQEELAKKIML